MDMLLCHGFESHELENQFPFALCALNCVSFPVWLTSMTPRTMAGRGLEVPMMLSVAAGGPTWEPELGPGQKRKYLSEDWMYHSYLLFEYSSERFVSVLKRFSNPYSRIYKYKWVLSPLKSIGLFPWHCHRWQRIWNSSLGTASDSRHPRLPFKSKMTFSSWVTHLLLSDFTPNYLELVSKMKSALKWHRVMTTEDM